MRTLIFIGACFASITACGGENTSPQDRLTELCKIDENTTRQDCACMAKAAVDTLPEGLLAEFIKLAAQEPNDVTGSMVKMVGDLEPEEMQAFLRFDEALAICKVNS